MSYAADTRSRWRRWPPKVLRIVTKQSPVSARFPETGRSCPENSRSFQHDSACSRIIRFQSPLTYGSSRRGPARDVSEPSSTATQNNTIGLTHHRCAPNEARRTEGVRTRILIIDDDRRSPVRLHRLQPGDAANGATAGKAKRNGGMPGAGANGSADHITLALPEHEGDLAARGAVLDMDAALVRDVLARVQELLAQAEPDGEEPESAEDGHAGIVIDLPTQTVWRSGRPVRVTPTEFRLLVALVRRRGAVVSREDLRREVWPDGTEVQSRVIDSHIARLRRKLEHDPKQPRHILTALAAGYRFLA